MAETFFDRVNKNKTLHTPDVLSCLANLSNDEVFTPPEVVNKMLDMLPQELFRNPETTFLDPACKTGVFLREIAKRLLVGLEDKIPDLQQRVDHIFHKQLFGIAITELTSLLSRRSVYCSKSPDGRYSVSHFNSPEGNIRFKKVKHTWVGGKCKYCGASQSEYDRASDLETHAYEFIHVKPEEIFNMKFDVIISNPPYQLNDGGGMGASAIPLYHKFVEQAKKLNPRHLTMIIPSRWFAGGKGLDEFRDTMLKDNHISIMHDYIDAHDCFPGVEIKGGVCYFLRDSAFKGECSIYTHIGKEIEFSKRPLLETFSDTYIRYGQGVNILKKVFALSPKSFSSIVSNRNPFGFSSNFNQYSSTGSANMCKIYMMNRKTGFIDERLVTKNGNLKNGWKILISKAIGTGDIKSDVINPYVVEPNTICTETYLAIGPFKSEEQAKNALSYMYTNFFRMLLGLKKITQNTTSKSYAFIPMQDFSKPWTDKELYAKYCLTQEEIDFIESMIRPMDGGEE